MSYYAHNAEVYRERRIALRDPVENAFMAFFALSDSDKFAFCNRFNAFEENAGRAARIEYTDPNFRPERDQ